ncbi:hypothetical protein [Hyphomicrobium facile]|uniref:Uncharacterized protein n=1 Tax=Hyphomicrobium facile TaxID=51670 RepID=A0A1I7MTM4_9HYPH|nr:hypothetical protein [Hyphomicrobium facile]SFV25752.1 hypothetical protein SAMN04488557_0091 [Hyphomicrobium facile]
MKPIIWPFKRPELREAPISIDVADVIVFRCRDLLENFNFLSTLLANPRRLPGSKFLRVDAHADDLIAKEMLVDNFNPIFEFDQGDLGDAAFQHSLRGIHEGQNSIDR